MSEQINQTNTPTLPVIPPEGTPFNLDIGCGKNKVPGYYGIDALPFDGVDFVYDLTKAPWPFPDNSVDDVHCSHFLEHLTNDQRVTFFNELYRVLKPNKQARIITPHWSHERAYGDPTHQWPPVTSFAYYYLVKSWREVNAPHCGYTCDFNHVIVGIHAKEDTFVAMRNDEVKSMMMTRYINTVTDMIATITKVPPVPPAPAT